MTGSTNRTQRLCHLTQNVPQPRFLSNCDPDLARHDAFPARAAPSPTRRGAERVGVTLFDRGEPAIVAAPNASKPPAAQAALTIITRRDALAVLHANL
jgi:hypothetical protein